MAAGKSFHLKYLASVCLMATAAWPLKGQDRPFDLLIKNGHVIDPRNGIDAVMDVAIAGGKIASVSRSIEPSRAGRVADTSRLYVVPGLVDLHAHVSTDLHTGSMNDGMKDILNTMSKFLNMGMSLQDVVKSNSSRAAEIIKRTDLPTWAWEPKPMSPC